MSVELTPVVIFQRSTGPEADQKLYAKLHAFLSDQAMTEKAENGESDVEIIKRHTRVMQQMAANSTEIAMDMGVNIDE